MKYWSDITPDMMSEEEKVGDTYVRHPPSYRSSKLQEFIDKLDARLEKRTNDRPRISRTIGSPRKATPPFTARKWTIKQGGQTSR